MLNKRKWFLSPKSILEVQRNYYLDSCIFCLRNPVLTSHNDKWIYVYVSFIPKQDGLLNKNKKKGNESELYNNIIILKYYNIIF